MRCSAEILQRVTDGYRKLRNTARFAFRASKGILGAAPILGEVLRRSVADDAKMPDKLVARYLAPYVGAEGLNHLAKRRISWT